MDERYVVANGVRFAHLEWDGGGPLALLLHGFPDTAHTWRELGPQLADAGFRVVAPWLRGYAPSGLAPDDAYDIPTLAADANRLHAVLGGGPDAVLVGHDWGAIATYAAIAAAPERWARAVTLAVPPLAALGAVVGPRQVRRSWYLVAAQLPWERLAPERALARIERLWQDWSPGRAPTEDDLGPLRRALADPDHLRAALSYYRQQYGPARRGELPLRHPPTRTPPTLYLHGVDDGCMGVASVEAARDVLLAGNRASRAERVPGAGHFLHLDAPERVGRRVREWLAPDGVVTSA